LTIVVPTENGDCVVVTCPQCEGRRPLDAIIADIELFVAIKQASNVLVMRVRA
jgi:hypothetical protein